MDWFCCASKSVQTWFGREPYLATNLAGLTGPTGFSPPMADAMGRPLTRAAMLRVGADALLALGAVRTTRPGTTRPAGAHRVQVARLRAGQHARRRAAVRRDYGRSRQALLC